METIEELPEGAMFTLRQTYTDFNGTLVKVYECAQFNTMAVIEKKGSKSKNVFFMRGIDQKFENLTQLRAYAKQHKGFKP